MRALAAAELAGANVLAFNPGGADLPQRFGEALYGNICGGWRLDFTWIGPAINLAARGEKVAARLGRTIVATKGFAEPLCGAFERLGAFELAGFQQS